MPRTLRTAMAVLVAVMAVSASRLAQCAPSAEAAARIRQQIDAELAAPGLRGGVQGVLVESLRDGAVWYSRDERTLLMPASNQKVLTSTAALALLGRDYHYVTKLVRTGTIDADGVLHGDLYLVGSGDPILRVADLETLASATQAAGIKSVTGRVYGDDSRFDRIRYGIGWSWEYLAADYAPQLSGLNMDENVMSVRVSPGPTVDSPVTVQVSPMAAYVTVVNRGVTGPAKSAPTISIDRELGLNRITVDGSLAVDASGNLPSADVTMENPARYAAILFVDRLRATGVTVQKAASVGTAPTSGAVEVARHTGEPLIQVIHELNQRSDNLIAECLLKTLGAEKGKAGSSEEGWRVAFEWYRSVGLDTSLIDPLDGSGLTRRDRITPRFMVSLLRVMWGRPGGKEWMDTLPLAGRSGTLARRMKGTPAEGNCLGKTGSVANVSCLSGYVTTKDGEPLVFSILMNNQPEPASAARVAQDHIVVLLASYTEAAAK